MSKTSAARLVKLDPANAATYNANAAGLRREVRRPRGDDARGIGKIPGAQRWLVTSEGAFPYLARNFGMRELFLWAVNSDQQGTPQQVQQGHRRRAGTPDSRGVQREHGQRQAGPAGRDGRPGRATAGCFTWIP
jgi:ABC-type Zn2+ transport system substrate-binding protein/surface adhesin